MTQYDFETLVRREGVGSAKWDSMMKIAASPGEDVIPFSGGEMEFVTAPPIAEALRQAVDSMILGNMEPDEAYGEALGNWMKKRHGFAPKPEWIVNVRSVAEAINLAIKAYTEAGEGILLLTPHSREIGALVAGSGRKAVECALLRRNISYEIDFEDFEKKVKSGEVRLFLLCNPHTPVARVWKKKELERLGKICLENGVVVVSDESWLDLVMKGQRHWIFAAVAESFLNNCVICTTPGVTFNIGGLEIANVFIPGSRLRKLFRQTYESVLLQNPRCNILSYIASRRAWEKCEDWLEQALKVIERNKNLIAEFLQLELPQLKLMDFEGTYHLWLNCKGLGLDYKELERLNKTKARLFFTEGYTYGEQGESFERWNIACPTRIIEGALHRMKGVYKKYAR
ncbi:MAG: aminotransferase class I/II-fold pyridoxal phosphate-dependent enzyme [Fusobacteriaceae bacterium]|jgi:cystathionine beta-lyase|nr:aminotransferase class I/II-fold pyridoxal phosphate-dependent enzyme [Fusobacteriaceae bacterium]